MADTVVRDPVGDHVLTPQPDPRRWKALALLGVAYLMVVLDVTIVNVALPSIQKDLNFSPENLQWVISAYGLTFGGLLLLGGRTGDILGRRRLFMVGLGLFALFSLSCGLATSSGMLIAFRALQGSAGAILSPSVFSIVTVTFEEGKERNTALGILGGIAGSGAAIGVLLGGILTEFAGWEWVFFVNVPIGVLALFFVRRFVRESRSEGIARSFDAGGAFAVTSSLMVLVYALTQASQKGWGSTQTIALLLVSTALMVAFLLIESRVSHPLLRLGFFRQRTPTGANIIGFGVGTMLVGMFFLLSLYMQDVLGFSALKTGLAYLAVSLMAIVASGISQALVTRLGVKPILSIGMIMLTIGLLLFAQISAHGSYIADLFPGFIILGIGLGFSFVPISIAALAGVRPDEAGLASGLINTSQQIGGALGVAILTTVAVSRTNHELADGASKAVANTAGYQLAFYVAAAFAVANLIATLLILHRRELEPSPAGAAALVTNRTEGRSSVSTEQRETLDAILRQSAFPVGSDVDEQRRLLRELLSAQPLPAEVTVTAAAAGRRPDRRDHGRRNRTSPRRSLLPRRRVRDGGRLPRRRPGLAGRPADARQGHLRRLPARPRAPVSGSGRRRSCGL